MSDEPVLASGFGGSYRVGKQIGREEGCKEERQRIVALIHEHIVRWQSGEYFGHELAEYDDFDEVIALKRLLRDVEDTSHE
jgi:hypothetical protein